ncbi:MAG TPA: class I SAM-dependent methyltransferase [Anaerolineales bacterium]|nr:class I SAM-dependent methyltransferase [Anaerolineales bacterium]
MDSKLYHIHHQFYQEDLPFWQAMAEGHPGAVLELGCGTGRVLLALRQAGIPAYGLDIDAAMLAILKESAPAAPVFQADLTHFRLDQSFGFIFIACNTWSTLPAGQREAALAGIVRHLAPGGIFIASLPNPEFLLAMEDSQEAEPETSFLHPDTGNPVQVSSEWAIEQHTADQRIITFSWHYDHLTPDGQVKRITNQARHWIKPPNHYLTEIRQSGLKASAWGDYDQTPYSPDSSPYLLLAGEKI